MKMQTSLSMAPNQVWLAIFFPALVYYTFYSPATTPILSYLNLLPSYTPLETTINLEKATKEEIGKLLDDGSQFETVFTDETASFYDMTWMEDVDLGRGYLLLSDSSSSGKVWRYETGGGLVPIGKSLFLDHSGCRSNLWASCETNSNAGSKGLVAQISKDEDNFQIGSLIIVETGEARIVRLEEDGARTPLVLNVLSPCGTGVDGRLNRPGRLLYTPFGDLLFTDTAKCSGEPDEEISEKTVVYRLKEVVNIPHIKFQQSRDAHSWIMQEMALHNPEALTSIELSYTGMDYISDMIVGKDLTSLFIAGSTSLLEGGCRRVITKVNDDTGTTNVQNLDQKPIFFDMSTFYPSGKCSGEGIAMAINADGYIFASYPGGVALIDPWGELLSTITVVMESKEGESIDGTPNGLIIGNDGYLYMTTGKNLLRLKLKTGTLDYPTNMIVPRKK